MSSTKISVAIPVYNRQDCIGACIESALKQTSKPFEIVIVDDGSTDRTKAVIESYAKQYNHISFFPAPKNGGENYARNRCIEMAKGDFILWLDSDDYLVENAVESVESAMADNPGFKHYMFLTSDRMEEFKTHEKFSKETYATSFEDWVTFEVFGDFAHVMHKSVFEGLPFFENIRGFPGMNFLRIHRKTGKQLYVNKLVTNRDRSRDDALCLTGFLDNKKSIKEQYINNNYYLDFFEDDLLRFDKRLLEKQARKNLLLGIAINEIKKNKEVIRRLRDKKVKVFPFNLLNIQAATPFVYSMLTTYVRMKRKGDQLNHEQL
jgi:glycosyltransferase involved in cell wall biosynthesis